MSSISTYTFNGHLGRDPETRYTPSGQMNVSFSVGVNPMFANGETTWVNVTCWGKLGESMNKLAEMGALAKGRMVIVTGDLRLRTYTGNDGVQRASLDVNANVVQLVGQREDQ